MKAETVNRLFLSSSLWGLLASTGGQAFSFLAFVQVARSVVPAEFGLVTFAALIIDLLLVVALAGLSDAVIQRPNLSERDADTAFWTALAAGLVMFGLVMVAANAVATAFGLPELGWVLRVLAPTFLITPLGAIHAARLTRSFGFRALAFRSLTANLAGGALAVGVATAGGGVTALLAQRLTTVAVLAATSWSGFRWCPAARFDLGTCREMMRFGLPAMGSQVLQQLSGRSAEVVAGITLGPAAVGVLRVANRCVEMLIQMTVLPVQSLALPALSRLSADPVARSEVYARLSRLMALPMFAAYGGAFALAPTLLPLAFGPQWQEAAGLLRVILLTAVSFQVGMLLPAVLAAAGHPGVVFRWSAVHLVASYGFCALGSLLGPSGLVAAVVLRAYLMLPYALRLLRRHAGIGAGTVLGCLVGPLLVAATTTLSVQGLQALLPPQMPPVAILLLAAAAGTLVFGISVAAFMRGTLREMLALGHRRGEAATLH